MNRFAPSLPRPARVLPLVALAAMLNVWPLPWAPGEGLWLGSLVIMPLVLVLPAPWSVVAALVAAAPTLLVPVGLCHTTLVALEAAWLTWMGRRMHSAALADVLFWLLVGGPIDVALCSALADAPAASVLAQVVHHALTSVATVLLVDFLVRSTRFGAWLDDSPRHPQPLRLLIFNWVFAIATLPLVVMGLGLASLLRNTAAARDADRLREAVHTTGHAVEEQLRMQLAAVVATTRTLQHDESTARQLLADVRSAHPAMITMVATDAAGRIIACSPHDSRLIGNSVADRAYFATAQRTMQPYVSKVFRGRGFGRDILVALSVPRVGGDGRFEGVVEASLEVRRLAAATSRTALPADVAIALVDSAGRVVFADAETGLRPLQAIRHSEFNAAGQRPVPIALAGANGLESQYLASAQSFAHGFRVIATVPAVAGIEQVLWIYALLAGIVAVAIASAVVVARTASRQLASPLERFAIDAVDQAESGSVEEMDAPEQDVPREIAMVFAAFNCLAGRVVDAHAALVKTNTELDARVAERTKELQEAQARAEAASRAKTDFVAMTGHEIRTPLNVLIGLADAVAPEVPPGIAADRLRLIRRTGARMLGIVNDLLDLSRVEAGKLELRRDPVELGAMVREVIALFSTQAQRQGVTLQVEISTSLPLWLKLDAARLQQLLINLVGNALKFTREGVVALRVQRIAETPGDVTLRFAVIDSGPGIKPEEQARLFQPYVQIPGSAPKGEPGTGLGLAISRRLAELHGGTLAVASEAGRGAEFYFSATFERAAPVATAAAASSASETAFPELRVLVIDDNPANQEVLRAILERRCAGVECADSARAGLAMLESSTFDLALVDLEMPDEGGDAVVHEMRARGPQMRSRDCVLVAVSAHARDEKRAECVANGFADFLGKPIDRQQLFRLLSEIAATRR